jgi:hypothetical protein
VVRPAGLVQNPGRRGLVLLAYVVKAELAGRAWALPGPNFGRFFHTLIWSPYVLGFQVPQIFICGQLIGGCDTLRQLLHTGQPVEFFLRGREIESRQRIAFNENEKKKRWPLE